MTAKSVEQLLVEGDSLLFAALAQRDQTAMDRLYAITNELLNDHEYNGAELGRRWGRGRSAISVWKQKGAVIRGIATAAFLASGLTGAAWGGHVAAHHRRKNEPPIRLSHVVRKHEEARIRV